MTDIPRDYPIGHGRSALSPLSFDEAQQMGRAMFDRWQAMFDAGECSEDLPPPFEREDGAWADLARASYEKLVAVRCAR